MLCYEYLLSPLSYTYTHIYPPYTTQACIQHINVYEQRTNAKVSTPLYYIAYY
jgi:hypothetical protein